ncbi:hypothetical protein Lal_00030519 [Lupinus albus]|uniref:Putative transcription repressor PLATZ family n=1 Tax=Lupinus albus TaxID=3870 RepID=A0A6A5LXD5_LUPAL|nr:putative transcription repressor PLATZ family [Lupinus albus]KAF1863485.1 hypothetical protein Lal_00030519 [Lupinus albus]
MHHSCEFSPATIISSESHSLVLPLKHPLCSEASLSTVSVHDEHVEQSKDNKLWWLLDFLGETFFNSCEAHPCGRNELNHYCLSCNKSACKFCISSGVHHHHQILKIHRYNHIDVVYLINMREFINCSEIQPYKSKRKMVISLNPLPQNRSGLNDEGSCKICSRKLNQPNKYHYCSISCKVKAVLEKRDDSFLPFICIKSHSIEETCKLQSLRKRRRKTTPHRAPFF